MSDKKIKNLYNQKLKELNLHNQLYYDKSKPKISDVDYDNLKQSILEIEKKYPYLRSKNSPSLSVGFKPSKNFEKSKHSIYNCSGEKGVTIKGLIYMCAEVCGLNKNDICLNKFDFEKLDPKSRKGFPIRLNHYQTDISKIKNDLNWEPKFDLLSGLKDSFIKDYQFKKDNEFDRNLDRVLFKS